MSMSKKELFKAAASGDRNGFNAYHGKAAAQVFKDEFNHLEAAKLRFSYAKNHYGKYALAATVFAATAFYLGALLLAPALIPFGLAAITTAWLKYTVASVMLAAVVYSGAIFLGRTFDQFKKLVDRFRHNELSNYDVALLTTTAAAGFGVVGTMYAFPTLLPVLGTLGTWTKAAAATTIAGVSTASAYAALFGRRPAAPTRGDDVVDLELGSSKFTPHGTTDRA